MLTLLNIDSLKEVKDEEVIEALSPILRNNRACNFIQASYQQGINEISAEEMESKFNLSCSILFINSNPIIVSDKEIQGGARAKATKSYSLSNGSTLFLKQITLDNEQSIIEFRNEVTVLDNLGRLKGSLAKGKKGYLITDLIKGQNLSEYKQNLNDIINQTRETDVLKREYGYFIHLLITAAQSLKEFHGLGYIHRDIKLANFMQQNDNCLLIDFGSSSKTKEPISPYFSTQAYFAPELLKQMTEADLVQFTRETDIYALGTAFQELQDIFVNSMLYKKAVRKDKEFLQLAESIQFALNSSLEAQPQARSLDKIVKLQQQAAPEEKELPASVKIEPENEMKLTPQAFFMGNNGIKQLNAKNDAELPKNSIQKISLNIQSYNG